MSVWKVNSGIFFTRAQDLQMSLGPLEALMSIEYIASLSPQLGVRVMYCGVPNCCSQEAGEKLMPKRTSEHLHRQPGKETITVKTGTSCGFSDCGKTHPSSQDILSL